MESLRALVHAKASLSAASFNALISAQGKAGCIAAAETTFGMMLSARVEPSQAPAPALAPAPAQYMPAKDNEDAEWVESARAQVSAAHQYPAMRALALDNYDPGDLGDLGSDLGDLGLGLRKGQELLVFDTAPAPVSWLIGESGGRRGLVPATYVAARLTLGYVVYVCVREGERLRSGERKGIRGARGCGTRKTPILVDVRRAQTSHSTHMLTY